MRFKAALNSFRAFLEIPNYCPSALVLRGNWDCAALGVTEEQINGLRMRYAFLGMKSSFRFWRSDSLGICLLRISLWRFCVKIVSCFLSVSIDIPLFAIKYQFFSCHTWNFLSSKQWKFSTKFSYRCQYLSNINNFLTIMIAARIENILNKNGQWAHSYLTS